MKGVYQYFWRNSTTFSPFYWKKLMQNWIRLEIYYIASLEKSKETHDEIKLGCFSIFQRQKRKENRKHKRVVRKQKVCKYPSYLSKPSPFS